MKCSRAVLATALLAVPAALTLVALPRPAAADPALTDAAVVTLLAEMEEVVRSHDVDRLVGFVTGHYTEDAAIRMTVNLKLVGQNEPVVQKVALTRQQQIDQFRQAAPLYSQAREHQFKVTVKDVLLEAGGAKARVLYEANETATFDAHTADGAAVTIRHHTAARCSAVVVPGPEAPAFADIDCVYNTTADQV